MSEAEAWAEHAYLRSCTSCSHAVCHSYTVLEALLMCMFYIWVEEYGPGWWWAIEQLPMPVIMTGIVITEGVCS